MRGATETLSLLQVRWKSPLDNDHDFASKSCNYSAFDAKFGRKFNQKNSGEDVVKKENDGILNQDLALLIGRVFMAVLFIIAAYNKFKGLEGTAGYFTRLGVPSPSLAAPLVALLELAGGIALIIGFRVRAVALIMGAFVIVASFIAHTNFADGNQITQFLKNLAIAGGFLALYVTGAGAHSVDARTSR